MFTCKCLMKNGTGNSSISHMMAMAFHDGYVETILFDTWSTTTVGSFVASVIGIFVITILYEAFKYGRDLLLQKSRQALISTPNPNAGTSTESICVPPKPRKLLSKDHGIQTLLHGVQFFYSYALMLIFMVYNVWICLAMVLGAMVGYFFFGNRITPTPSKDECCH